MLVPHSPSIGPNTFSCLVPTSFQVSFQSHTLLLTINNTIIVGMVSSLYTIYHSILVLLSFLRLSGTDTPQTIIFHTFKLNYLIISPSINGLFESIR